MINGLKMLGSTEALLTLVPARRIDQLIIIADASQASLRRILKICEGIPVRAGADERGGGSGSDLDERSPQELDI